MRSSAMPVSRCSHRSLTANGLCVVTTLSSPAPMPASCSARCAAVVAALGMRAFSARAKPAETRRATPSPPASARACARPVTMAPAVPSAGCVCVPKVTTLPSLTGFRPRRLSSVVACTPSSSSTAISVLPCRIDTPCRCRRRTLRSSLRAAWYCACRNAVTSSSAWRVKPPSLATASAVATIACPVHGSAAKLSSTQCSVAGLPPIERLRG